MKKLFLNIIKFIMVFLIIISTMFIGVGCGVYKSIIDETSIESKIEEVKENSNYTELDNIYKTFLDAIVAIEDHRFYKHGAIDLVSIARALITNLENGQILEGGSTITQQVAKNIFLTNEQSFDRKIKEICIAQKLENKYTKEEILELYVNVIYFGDGYIGIKEACNGYFNKEPNELSDNEATLLAGLPQAPSLYALNNNYDYAVERQKQVIEALEKWHSKNKSNKD
ncbi:biosynthetic peptidoglycan transglycosylase [Clostridium celatum]|uniref:biosynthetic peptidoglycan transglycosylase n=1 Tax=Clostridium celatum TaxID=36834 RepID=UPI001896AC7C|nr:biosynthetic peptidoglycan transglycosylase [Clostridium celatum]MCE9656850.1 transglycosylase domain-containing protein [Clostridium celatum]MDY3359090.1 biosynthetic peptidoglycan transglycosylase [Clostridium celatum]